MSNSSRFVQNSFFAIRKWLKKWIAPSVLLAEISKVIPISDRWYVTWRYFFTFGRRLNLQHPQTFTEKLQWLKLNDHPEQYAPLADKFAVTDYVREQIGETHINRLLGVYTRAEDIPWDTLPEKFVLKATHASGWNLIVTDIAHLDRQAAVCTCQQWLTSSYYARRHEPVYKNIPPRIICVEYLGDPDTELFDYKLYCFNGKVKLLHVDTQRFTHHRRTFYTPTWQRLPFAYAYPTSQEDLPRPAGLEEMVALAERLAGSIPFVRVDFFYIHDQVIFGEMTFYPDSGFGLFTPPDWDTTIGAYLELGE